MAAERGAGQQQSQEMMEGERPCGARTKRLSGRGTAACTSLTREKRDTLSPAAARTPPRGL